jgi:hypothetical protein
MDPARETIPAGSGIPQRSQTHARSDHKRSHVSDVEPAAFQPKAVHFRLLDAYEECLQDGVKPTDGVIAKKVGVQRETINRWRRQNSALRNWIFEQIGHYAAERRPFVDRRIAHLAESGSVEHAKLFYQFVAKVGSPLGDDGGDGRIVVNHNYLIPRPDYSQVAIPGPVVSSTPAPALPPVTPAKSKIPVVGVGLLR